MTKQELAQLLDEKLEGIATDIAASEARLATVEARMTTRTDLIEVRGSLGKLETRLTAVQGQLSKMETRLQKRFDELFDFLDEDVMENRGRIKTMDKRLEAQETRLRDLQLAVG
jgi:chromosome segregation ATPase